MTKGILYGIGVGPGDPDLLTIKAANTINSVDVLFAASSSANNYSQALDIARPHMNTEAEIVRLGFPMTRDPEILKKAWADNAARVLSVLKQGKNGAFLTLGDPMTYSTFSYLLTALTGKAPNAQVEIIPGITSYQAAAASARIPLAESGERLAVLPGVADAAQLRTALRSTDNAAILKAYRKLPVIKEVLEQEGLSEKAVFMTRIGLDGETLIRDLNDTPEVPHYFSLILVKNN